MVCDRCGNDIMNDAEPCRRCGNKPGVTGDSGNHVKENKSFNDFLKDKRILAIIGAASMFLVLVVVLFVSTLNEDAGRPIEAYHEALNNKRVETRLKAYPKELQKRANEDETIKKVYELELESERKKIENIYGIDVKISCEILDEEKFTKENLKKISADIRKNFVDSGYAESEAEVRIADAYTCAVKIIYKGEKGTEIEYKTIDVFKINGIWCMDD